MRIYTLGANDEYTISMIKQACDEFATLTDEQALKICELLAKYAVDKGTQDSIDTLQEENSELEEELESTQWSLDIEERKNQKLQEKIDKLEEEIEELKNATNK